MNNQTKSLRLGLFPGLFLVFAALATFAAQAKAQSLGTAEDFAVLGASTVTSAGISNVSGSVGVSPGPATTGFPPGIITNGALHENDGPAAQAHADLATAYDGFFGLTSPPENNLSESDLGGKTLTRGVYRYDTSANLDGVLTFDAQNDPTARFVILIGSTLTTSGTSSVVLINGADARNVYFQVGTSATLGIGSSFIGNILAYVSITGSGTTVTGRLLAVTGAVTLGANNITAPARVIHVAPVVTNTNDSGPASLRQALLGAEDNDAITFNIPTGDPGYNAGVWTISLTSGELAIDKNVTISGLGANVLTVQRDATASAFRILNVSPSHTVTIQGITISNGLASAGGGIYNNHSDLTVNRCALIGNSASSTSYGGGGIYSDGSSGSATLTVASSTLSGNLASNGLGGGISNNGVTGSATLTVVNSTLSGNSASPFGGGGIDNDARNGGSGPVTVTNSTLSDNSGGAGIVSFGELMVGNTILKTGASGSNIDSGSSITSLGYNLSNDNGSGLLTGTGDQINTDPILGPLKDNGGPTMTRAPLSNSPAIDMGKDIGLTGQGQRGGARPVTYDLAMTPPAGGDRSDIGAIELAAGVQSISAVSRKTHGEAGDFDINLPLRGISGIECRSGGATNDYQVILTFARPVAFTNAAVTSSSGNVANTSTNGNQVTINLTGVTNAQTITVALFGTNDGTNSGDVGVRMGVLLGDVDASARVDSNDVFSVRQQGLQPLTTSNFRNDVDVSGRIDSNDVFMVRQQN